MEIKTKKYTVDNIELNVAESGNGEPLVLIHGWSNSWVGWTLLAKELAPHYKLYMVDLPGFGDSSRLKQYSLEVVSSYVSTFITKYVGKPKAIIGASSGTFVSVHVATANNFDCSVILIGPVLRRKELVWVKKLYAKLLTFSSKHKFAQKTFEHIIKHRYSAYFIEKYLHAYTFNKKLVDLYQMPGRKKVIGKSYVELGVSIMQYFLDRELQHIKQNTLLIVGTADRYTPVSTAEAFMKKTKNKKLSLSVIPECGHSPAYEQPLVAAKLIREYLQNLS